jgi:hypothetical protein
MRQLAGQVLILLFAIIAPNDSVSCVHHPGSLIWQLHAGGSSYACRAAPWEGQGRGRGRGYNPNSEGLEYGIAGGRNSALMRWAFFLRPIKDLFNALPFV